MELFTTMITPYFPSGKIHYAMAERYVDWYFENGLTGIFSVCQSSEIFFLSLEERVELNRRVYARAKWLEKEYGRPFTVVSSGHVGDTFESQVKELNAIWQSGTDALIVCERMTDLYNPNVIRASTGAIFSVPTAVCDNQSAMDYLRKRGVKILAATPHTDFKYTDVDLTQPVAVVVGAEQTGLTDFWMEQADLKVNIPMLGEIDSLNVASAATILLYEAARQRGFKKRDK